MNNRTKFLNVYEKLSPLQAFSFAHEITFQINLRLCSDEEKEKKNMTIDPADISFCINQAFEVMQLSPFDQFDEPLPDSLNITDFPNQKIK